MIGSYREEGPLTPRVHATLEAAASGLTIAETALRLHVSVNTVQVERRVAIARLGARNMPHAVSIAHRKGLLP